MSVYPPDALDLARQWRQRADEKDAAAPHAKTMGDVWQCRMDAVALRKYADELEQHMSGRNTEGTGDDSPVTPTA